MMNGTLQHHAQTAHGDVTPAVSVVVPCYNAEATVGDTLESLLVQTHEDWEAICVDDGSNDSTASVLEEFARRDNRIRWSRVPHGGLSATRNRALMHARAPQVLFLDADDVARPEAIEILLRASRAAGNQAIVPAAYEWLDESGSALGVFRFPVVRKFSVEALLTGNPFAPMTLVPMSVLTPFPVTTASSAADRHRASPPRAPFDEALPACEDWDLWLRLAQAGVPCEPVARVLFGYRLRAGSLSRKAEVMYASGRRVIERWAPHARDARDPLLQLAVSCAALAFASGSATVAERLLSGSPALTGGDDDSDTLARSLEWAYAFVHGAAGGTWRCHAEIWLADIEACLSHSTLSAHAGQIVERLRDRLCLPERRVEIVARFIAQHGHAARLVIYGLGRNGMSLLEQFRRGAFGQAPPIVAADDHLTASHFDLLEVPNEDPRRWKTWPSGTILIVTPDEFRAMRDVLVRAGGREGHDYLLLTRAATMAGAAA